MYQKLKKRQLLYRLLKAEEENSDMAQASDLQLHYSLLNELQELRVHLETVENLAEARNKEIKRLNKVINTYVKGKI